MAKHTVRPAGPPDVPAIHRLVQSLADYEQAAEAVQASADDLAEALFGSHPRVFCHVAEVDDEVVGFALWFVTFSTWLGRHGIWLEDLFVLPEHRRLGLGRSLLAELADICVQRGYGRLEWSVLDWNEPAIRFYRSVGAKGMTEWTVQRLEQEALHSLARPAPPGSLDDVSH